VIEKTLPEADHRHACPAAPDRVETYPARRADGSEVVVVRCVDCAAQAIFERGGDDHDE